MTQASRLTAAIQRGVTQLHRTQLHDGEFEGYASRDPASFANARRTPAVFPTAIILSALNQLGPAIGVDELQERAARFLVSQQSTNGTYNYWARNSQPALTTPYPDDLDDTFCSLVALQEYRSDLVGAKVLAQAVGQLTHCESQVGGPYYTWIVPRSAPDIWRDVDLGVNCNVAYFLSRQGVILPQLTTLVEEAIEQGEYITPYYAASPYPVMYFISRFYRGSRLSKLQSDILDHRDDGGWWSNPLDSALAVTALLNTGLAPDDLDTAIERLLRAQSDGAWAAQALYLESRGENEVWYVGSVALTSALALEALAKYGSARATAGSPMGAPDRTPAADELYNLVVGQVRLRFDGLAGDLREQAKLVLTRQLQRDHDRQIVLLPYLWENALKPSLSRASRTELVTLGLANLYGWMAYTIYDDFLDGEGQPPQISVANVALRELTLLLESLAPLALEVPRLVRETMARIDEANTWEVSHCRATLEADQITLEVIPDYGNLGRLAERSLGHALGPLCLLLIRGHKTTDPAVALTLKFFHHYLIARQLNDDVHDWEADLARGHVNAVGAVLLQNKLGASGSLNHHPLPALLAELKQQLWAVDIVAICEQIFLHAATARRALEANSQVSDAEALLALLSPLEGSAREALAERAKTDAFIKAYKAAKRPAE